MCTGYVYTFKKNMCVSVEGYPKYKFFTHFCRLNSKYEIFPFHQTIHFYLVIKDKFSTITDGLNY